MRANEFITEERARLDPKIADPLKHTFIIPGIRNNDAYHTYRLGTAMARARADIGGVSQDFPEFTDQSAFGQNAIVVGFNDQVDAVIDRALAMTGTPGGKTLIGTKESEEPTDTATHSPVRAFAGYPR
jgi:hypothetical protein